MNPFTSIAVALIAMFCLSSCEDEKTTAPPATETIDGGIQRTFSYFHGPRDSYTRILVEITGEETRISEFGGNGPVVFLGREVGVKMFDQFLELEGIKRFKHREELRRDTELSHLFWLYERNNGYSKYTVPITSVAELPDLREWLSDFLRVAANLKTRSEQDADDQAAAAVGKEF